MRPPAARPRRRWLALALALALAGACDRPERTLDPAQAPPELPAGTVLAVDGEPILLSDVEQAVPWVERISPASTPPQLLRLALTHFALPRAVARAIAEPGARERAAQEAREALGTLRDGRDLPEGVAPRSLEGGFKLIGLQVWGLALDLPEGTWSEVHEGAGHFLLLRRLHLHPAPAPLAIEFKVEVLLFPYLDETSAPAAIEAAYDRVRLRIVDPAWREIVPELLQYRMGAR